MSRAFVLVLDSLGVGGAPDAAAFGDAGADTLGHIAQECDLRVPNLAQLGLGEACRAATGQVPRGLEITRWLRGHAGSAAEISTGKDSQSGHWEIAGTPVEFEWGYFPQTEPCFPQELVFELCERGGLDGILGNRHASGTEIIAQLGEQHVRTGQPICYTSADSVFQIAAHEEHFGLQRLYDLCAIARKLVDPLRIGRVIARPFIGEKAPYQRTANRRDYGVMPPHATLLRRARAAHREIVSVGKIGDLFCHDATGRELRTHDNDEVFSSTVDAARCLADGGLLMANFVDFDTLFGHRRDVAGYAAALEAFDQRLPEFVAGMRDDDLAIITGDHGCDPTWRGTDHTRECIPVLAFGPHLPCRSLGRRDTFADIGATLATHLRLPQSGYGSSF